MNFRKLLPVSVLGGRLTVSFIQGAAETEAALASALFDAAPGLPKRRVLQVAKSDQYNSAQDYFRIYEELIGYAPPRIQERIHLGLEVDPELLRQVEEIRTNAMYPSTFDVKTAQLMLFGILLGQVLPAAEFHAVAAKRAGATKEELHAVAGLAFLFRGLPAFNLGAEVINKIFGQSRATAQGGS